MAGTSPGFSAADFRTAITAAMQMGAPPDVARRAKFVFPAGTPTYVKGETEVTSPKLDREGKPLDPDVRIVATPGAEVTVDCAVQIVKADAEEIPVGNFRPTKAIVTLLDTAHAQVAGARELVYNGDRYVFGYEPEALGMFDVGVFTQVYYGTSES
jgi:hypothetical protein